MKWMKRSFILLSSLIVMLDPLTRLINPNSISATIQDPGDSTYIVDRLSDDNPDGGGEGSGLTGDLRYALTNAQKGDSVALSVSGTINLSGALPKLSQDLNIEGPNMGALIVRGVGGSVFSIGSGATVVISNLTITGGSGNGGGIFNNGTLTLNNVTVNGNRAGDPTNGGGTGGGIWNYVNGTLTLNRSTVSANTVLGSSSYNPSRGGGIANYGVLTLNNSTVSGNSAVEGAGGGISNTLVTSTLMLNNSTVSANSASGVIGIGSGIDSLGTVHISNSIVAGNTKDDLRGTFISDGHNLIGNTKGASGFRPDLGDLLHMDPWLDSLKSNGGLTETHALLAGSPAIDHGDDLVCPQTDQRGYSRPIDGDEDGMAVCDIGSYEFDGVPSAVTPTLIPVYTLTATIAPSPPSTDTPSPILTFTPTPASTDTPTVPVTPTSAPAPPTPPCSGAVIPLIFIALLRWLRLWS